MEHYHVTSFINGCLNDYDSEALETKEDAITALESYISDDAYDKHWKKLSDQLYVSGVYIAQVEFCRNEKCLEETNS
jgi:hypothetical protein